MTAASRSTILHVFCVAAVALWSSACSVDETGAAAGSESEAPWADWSVSAEPTLQIGVVEGDTDYQFHQLLAAMVLPDGRIATLNAGSHELRIYDGNGRLLRRTGRRGEGPGEFRRPARLYQLADTLAVYDAGLDRMSLYTLTGDFVGVRELERTAGKFAMDEWLYDRSWVDGPALGKGREAIKAALSRLPPPDTIELYRYVRVSQYGHLWLRQPAQPAAATRSWQIYDIDGNALARVDIPAELEIYDYGKDYLIGRARDSLDVEYLRMYRFDTGNATMPLHTYTGSAHADTTVADSATAAAQYELRGALRMLTAKQEIFYSQPANSYRYSDDITKLADYQPPDGVAVRIVKAHERGWTAVAVDRRTGIMCGMAIGVDPPVGWSPGIATCLN